MKYAAIYQHRNDYPILTMCQFFGVSRSGYYDYARQIDKPDKDESLAILIGECQAKTNSTYGYRRIKAWIRRQAGVNVNHKAILRVMNKWPFVTDTPEAKVHLLFRIFASVRQCIESGFSCRPAKSKMGHRHIVHSNKTRRSVPFSHKRFV